MGKKLSTLISALTSASPRPFPPLGWTSGLRAMKVERMKPGHAPAVSELRNKIGVVTRYSEDDQRAFQQAFDELGAAMRRGRSASARAAGADLTAAQVDVLTPLADAGADGLPVSRLAELAGVAVPTVTRMMHGLRKRGIVEQRRSPSDARFVIARLTEPGRELLENHLHALRARQHIVFEAFPPEEIDVLVRGVRRMTQLINDNVAQGVTTTRHAGSAVPQPTAAPASG